MSLSVLRMIGDVLYTSERSDMFLTPRHDDAAIALGHYWPNFFVEKSRSAH